MENKTQTQVEKEEVKVNPELKEQAIKDMSLKEGLDGVVIKKEIVKEDKAKIEEETKTLKEKILSIFKSKTVAEMTDPYKLREMVKNDSKDLGKISTASTGFDFSIDLSVKYRDLIKKYNMNNEEGERMIKEIELAKKELDKMDNGPEKIEKRREFNEKHFKFVRNLHDIVEKRIQELS